MPPPRRRRTRPKHAAPAPRRRAAPRPRRRTAAPSPSAPGCEGPPASRALSAPPATRAGRQRRSVVAEYGSLNIERWRGRRWRQGCFAYTDPRRVGGRLPGARRRLAEHGAQPAQQAERGAAQTERQQRPAAPQQPRRDVGSAQDADGGARAVSRGAEQLHLIAPAPRRYMHQRVTPRAARHRPQRAEEQAAHHLVARRVGQGDTGPPAGGRRQEHAHLAPATACMGGQGGRQVRRVARWHGGGKTFFFEKKKQKTFASCVPRRRCRTETPIWEQRQKVFWCFFSKKNTLAAPP